MAKKIIEIEGIGPARAEKFQSAGISTVEELLEKGATKAGRKEIAGATGIDEKLVLKFVNMADLFRISGVGEEYAELLEAAGVDTIKELRNRVPANLHQKIVEVNNEKKLVRQTPPLANVEKWVDFAKTLDPKVTY